MLQHLLTVLLVVPNVAAIYFLVVGVRTSDLAELRRHTRRAALSVAAFLGGGAILVVLGVWRVFGAISGEFIDPGHKARILAESISEAMNTVAFLIVAGVLPIGAVAFLKIRSMRLASRARKFPGTG